MNWSIVGSEALQIFLLVLVATGAVPVLAGALSFVAIPFHAFKNHYKRAAPYLPRVAIVVPAWNEAPVLAESIDRLMALDYPLSRLRVYVVDDASTDNTPEVVGGKALEYPGSVFHLRRDKGGEGKAHTLNHGIREILLDDWMEALLIMDADVIYTRESLRKMTRHLADPKVGAVSAYIREGSADKNYLTRFIGFEYVLSQPAARRAQNVLGAQACLAGGARRTDRYLVACRRHHYDIRDPTSGPRGRLRAARHRAFRGARNDRRAVETTVALGTRQRFGDRALQENLVSTIQSPPPRKSRLRNCLV
jgi:cellulose synthase/poly-beta-1,6-N-acetylglucosamine synthase-like glycosyltransferase